MRSASLLFACLFILSAAHHSEAAPCSYTLSPTSASISASATSNAFSMTAGSGCAWNATTTNGWIHTASSGTGNGMVSYTIDANSSSSARVGAITAGGKTFSVTQAGAPLSLNAALDNDLVWTTSSPYPWYGTNSPAPSFDGQHSAVCANTAVPDSESWLETTVTGPGHLSFWWKVVSDPADALEFYVDGEMLDTILGSVDWSYRSFQIPAGSHTLRWRYWKDDAFNAFPDKGWLDQIKYTTNVALPLQTALDTCGVTWTTGGNANPTYWTVQSNVTHDGISAAQSGAIYTSQETWMQAQVSGVTNVSFWWKVSSQENYDYLEFFTNNVLAKRISGEVDWQSNYFRLPATSNTLKWRFAKTNFNIVPQGQNAGWVDQVTFSKPDPAPPVILYAFTNLTLSADSACGALLPDLTGTNYFLAEDSCGSVTVNQSPVAGTALLPGTNMVVLTATDEAGNFIRSSNMVVVADTTAPVITILGPNPLVLQCQTPFSDPGATATDNCSVTLSTNGTVLTTVGSYTISYRANDSRGNSVTNTRVVNVVDTVAPMITLNGASLMYVECHGSFIDPGASAQDTCAGTLNATAIGTVNVNSPGTNTITYVANDGQGNSNQVSRTVVVQDTTNPDVTLNGDSLMFVECHGTFNDPGASAQDACAGTLVAAPSGTVNTSTTGTNVITYTAVDSSGNNAQITRTVVVVDTTAPVLSLSVTQLMLNATANCQVAVPNLTETNYAVVDDLCGSVTLTQAPLPGTLLGLGTNSVVLTAVDSSGNSTNRTLHVVVVDATAPSMMEPAELVVATDPGQCSAANVSLTQPGVEDCSSVIVSNNAPGIFPIGTNLVTWTAIDLAGNSTNRTQRVIVRDMEAPTIGCAVAVTVTAEAGQNHASAVSLGTPATSDNCQLAGVTNDAPAQFPLGTNVVTWTVTDAAGNQNTCTQQVIVNAAPALPHSVSSLVRNPDGTSTVSFLGTPQVSYTVQVSSNLVDWVSVQTNSASEDGTWSYLDLEAANVPIRFYRAARF